MERHWYIEFLSVWGVVNLINSNNDQLTIRESTNTLFRIDQPGYLFIIAFNST